MIEFFFSKNRWLKAWNFITPFQPSVAIDIENSHMICVANQMTGFYLEYNTVPKWVKQKSPKLLFSCEFCEIFRKVITEKLLKATYSVKFENNH